MTQKSRTDLHSEINANLADNSSGAITAADVRGALNDLSDSCFNLISDTPAGANYWSGSGDDIYNNNPGGTGIGQIAPQAQLHVSPTIALPTGVSAYIVNIGAATGYAFGSGDKNYTLYGENSSLSVFSPGVGTTFTEPPSSDYEPIAASASFNFAGTGYIADDSYYDYQIYALYGGNAYVSVGSVDSVGPFTDPNDGSSFSIGVSWSPPLGATPDSYMVVMGGSNANTGLMAFPGSSTSFTDDNTSWGTDSFPPILYNVALNWTSPPALIDNFILNNGTTGTWNSPGNTTAQIDDSTWSNTPITVTPTGNLKTAIFEGSDITINSVEYEYPATPAAGFLYSDGATPANLQYRGIQLADVSGATDNEILYGFSGGNIYQSSALAFDGQNFTLGAGFAIGSAAYANAGTLNNFNVSSVANIRFSNNVIITGFYGGVNGKLLIVNTGATLTLNNQDSGSAAANRIITGTGGAITLTAGQSLTMQYDGNASRWRVLTRNIDLAHEVTGLLANANLANSTVSGIALGSNLAALTGANGTLTFSGAYTGGTAATVGLNLANANTWSALQTFGAGVALSGQNIVTDTTTGTKIGTAASQKIGFFNATPVAQPANTAAINDVLANTGLRASGGVANFTAQVKAAAATTAAASLNIPAGTAPASPNDGDMWYDGTNLKFRLGGTTKTVTLT